MKCQVCRTRAATVHTTVLSEGLESDHTHLCEECYAQRRPEGSETLDALRSALAPTSRPARPGDSPR